MGKLRNYKNIETIREVDFVASRILTYASPSSFSYVSVD